jgi:hypothetical protein
VLLDENENFKVDLGLCPLRFTRAAPHPHAMWHPGIYGAVGLEEEGVRTVNKLSLKE